jgi:hypothetical protein
MHNCVQFSNYRKCNSKLTFERRKEILIAIVMASAVNGSVTAMAVALVRHKCDMISRRMRTSDPDYTASYGRIIGLW